MEREENLRPAQVIALYNIGRSTYYEWRRKGIIPAPKKFPGTRVALHPRSTLPAPGALPTE